MFENKNELEAREEILGIVDEYCKKYHNQKKYKEGDRIPYASRVYKGIKYAEEVIRRKEGKTGK